MGGAKATDKIFSSYFLGAPNLSLTNYIPTKVQRGPILLPNSLNMSINKIVYWVVKTTKSSIKMR